MPRMLTIGEKKRNMSIVIYVPDEAVTWSDEGYTIVSEELIKERYEKLCDFVEDLHIMACVSPLHYADKYDENGVRRWVKNHTVDGSKKLSPEDEARCPKVGQAKKPHWHVFMYFGGGRTYSGMRKMWKEWNVTKFWVEDDRKVAIRYQAHLDSPSKAVYDPNEVRPFGGLDVSCLFTLNKQDKLSVVASICAYIKESECNNFFDLTNKMLAQEDPELFDALLTRTPFFINYMAGLTAKLKKKDELSNH